MSPRQAPGFPDAEEIGHEQQRWGVCTRMMELRSVTVDDVRKVKDKENRMSPEEKGLRRPKNKSDQRGPAASEG